MRSGSFFTLIILMIFISFSGCSNHSSQPIKETKPIPGLAKAKAFHTFNLEQYEPVDTTGMVKKVDHFAIIFDPSASMTETYETSDDCITCHTKYKDSTFAENHAVEHGGREFKFPDADIISHRCNECHQDHLFNKFNFARQLTLGFNQTIPDFKLTSTFMTFGYPVYSRLKAGPDTYDRQHLSRTIEKLFDADGASPLDITISDLGKKIFNLEGKKAVIIISDGEDMDKKDIMAAKDLKGRYKDDICIYTVHIGNDANGRKIMSDIADAGACGLTISGDTLLARSQMDEFVTEIFLKKDSDGDGVADDKDHCPDTLPGLKVDENGCWKLVVLDNLLFDFDKFNIKPEGIIVLNQVVALLKKHKFLDLHISGHTDNYGSMDYNIELSKNRARAGSDYIIRKGIEHQRLSVSWHSYSIPVAPNETSDGRALNRRLEFKFSKKQ